jgi:hypothetical protein
VSATIATSTITEELREIKNSEAQTDEANKKLRDFILSENFLKEKNTFLQLTSALEATLVTLEEAATGSKASSTPLKLDNENGNGAPPPGHQLTLPEMMSENSKSAFSYSRAMVLCVLIALSALLAAAQIIPPAWFVLIVAASLVMMFSDSIKEVVMRFLEKEEDEESTGIASLDWIVEQFTWIRQRYTSAYMLIHVQSSNKNNLQDYNILPDTYGGRYDRRKYFETTLPTDFLERIDRIIVRCKKDVWTRKQTLINALTVTGSAGLGGTAH